MTRRAWAGALATLGLLTSAEAHAAPAARSSSDAASAAAVGNLHRVAAALEATLDVYRLALVELVPAARKLAEAGQAPQATPHTPLPQAAHEVFARLAATVPSHVPADALPAISRSYHVEALDALDQLASAATLGQVVGPYQALAHGIEELCTEAAQVVDLFSRKRPIQVRVVDPVLIIDEINDALDSLAMAEANIGRLRQRRASSGEQLQGFLRLEISLRNALDLIAAAEESGIHVGFEVQLATGHFADILSRVRAQLAALAEALRPLGAKPAAIVGPLRAVSMDAEAGAATAEGNTSNKTEARLVWTAPQGPSRPAVVRIYRRTNREGVAAKLAAAYECEGHAASEALELARLATAELDEKPVLVEEIAPGLGRYVDPWHEAPLAPPIYLVVPVSVFGVEGDAVQATTSVVPAELEGPAWVRARSLAPAPEDSSFYRTFDTVRVTWQVSASDRSGRLEDMELARAQRRPLAVSYRVLRIVEERAEELATVPAGVNEYLDRPSLSALSRGVRYSVESAGTDDQRARSPAACVASPPVRVNLSRAARLARLGLGSLEHPTRFEQKARAELVDAAALRRARASFAARPAGEQEELLKRFWSSRSRAQRTAWLAKWPDLWTPAERANWLNKAPQALWARDRSLVQASVWLMRQPPVLQAEVDRWWELLDDKAREQATAEWRLARNRALREQIERGAASADGRTSELTAPARVLAWRASRDPIEQAELEQWWQELLPDERPKAAAEWLAQLPEALRRDLRWPDWDKLTPDEREQLLAESYRELPDQLWPDVLAFAAWTSLDEHKLAAEVAREVGPVARTLTALRFHLRPLDIALGFHLPVALGLVAALVALGLAVILRRRAH